MDELSDPSSSSSFCEDGSIISVSASHSAYMYELMENKYIEECVNNATKKDQV